MTSITEIQEVPFIEEEVSQEDARKLDIANRLVFRILRLQKDFEERARQAEKVKKYQHKMKQEKQKRENLPDLSKEELVMRTFQDPDLQADFELMIILRKFLNDNFGLTNEHYDILYKVSLNMGYDEFAKQIKPQKGKTTPIRQA